MSSAPIGILGLDPLGLALVQRLKAAGHRLLAWDGDPARRRALAVARPQLDLAGSLVDLGADCEIVVSTLPHEGLRAAALGDRCRDGFARALNAGSLIVDMGVAAPHETRVLAGILGRGGIGLIDAPAVGTLADAAAGTLTIPIGGFAAFVDRLQPMLEHFGRLHRAGGPGGGHTMAAMLAYRRYAERQAARETLRVAEGLGLAAGLLADITAAAGSADDDADPRLAIARRLAAEQDALSLKAASG